MLKKNNNKKNSILYKFIKCIFILTLISGHLKAYIYIKCHIYGVIYFILYWFVILAIMVLHSLQLIISLAYWVAQHLVLVYSHMSIHINS